MTIVGASFDAWIHQPFSLVESNEVKETSWISIPSRLRRFLMWGRFKCDSRLRRGRTKRLDKGKLATPTRATIDPAAPSPIQPARLSHGFRSEGLFCAVLSLSSTSNPTREPHLHYTARINP